MRRTVRRGHLFGEPLDAGALEEWTRRWPAHPLPEDLRQLLSRADGIHLWADLRTGRAYEGLAPLAEWRLARHQMYGIDAPREMCPDDYLAISYHLDGAAFCVLKGSTGEYFYRDVYGDDEDTPIGSDAGALLDWIWEHRMP